MAQISKIIAREILDSRGLPTIEAKLILKTGEEVVAQASSGESLGKHEGAELRDADPSRYNGLGVKKAVSFINDLIGPKLVGANPEKHVDIDYWLLKADGTKNKSRLGVNTILTVSQLLFKAAAMSAHQPLFQFANSECNKFSREKITIERLPSPIFNLINGGKHGSTNLEFQEFHIIPSTSTKFSEALAQGSDIYHSLKSVLDYRNVSTSVSEEGGFTPNLLTNTDALEVIKETIVQKKLKLGVDIFFGLDCASSHFFKSGKYALKDKPQALSPDDYVQFMIGLASQYNILVLEDPLDQEDDAYWKKITEKIGASTYIAADDFTSGDVELMQKALKENACNAVVLKFNQVGTITELFEITNLLKQHKVKIIFSQRLGETTDSIIADLAVGIAADFVKFGSPARGERVVKYNRLLEIETML